MLFYGAYTDPRKEDFLMGRPRKEVYITAGEASLILSERMQRRITPNYVFKLAQRGKIKSRPKDGRTNEYLKSDCETVVVTQYKWKRKDQEQPADASASEIQGATHEPEASHA
jgi:hypothetical protein